MNLTYGSRGDEVKKLQQTLNSAGYKLAEDGIYGNNTQAAVKDYQTKNGLTADGIAGEQTLGKLYGTATSSTQTTTTPENTQQTTQPAQQAPDYSQYAYDASTDAVYQQAMSALQQAQQALPTYQGSYDQQLQDIYNQIVNRDKFSYDLNSDMLYQQYADQYTQQGKMAMMDTMGQAAALTGGYSSSYVQAVGQQQYDAYLQQLNDVVPELYSLALDQYNQEGQDLLNQYAMVGDMADDEYGKYQDSLNQYWQNVSFLKGQADDAYSQGYNNWYNSYQMGTDAENTAYQRQQDNYSKLVGLMTEYGYAPTAEELAAAGMSQAEANAYRGISAGGSGGSGGSGGGSGYSNSGYSSDLVKRAQAFVGATADGAWGSQSAAAAKAKGYGSLGAVIDAMTVGEATANIPSVSYNGSATPGSASTAGQYFNYSSAANAQAQAEKGGSYYSDALAYLQEMKSAGATNAEASAWLKDAVGESYLTQSEYSRLYNLYRNNELK